MLIYSGVVWSAVENSIIIRSLWFTFGQMTLTHLGRSTTGRETEKVEQKTDLLPERIYSFCTKIILFISVVFDNGVTLSTISIFFFLLFFLCISVTLTFLYLRLTFILIIFAYIFFVDWTEKRRETEWFNDEQ